MKLLGFFVFSALFILSNSKPILALVPLKGSQWAKNNPKKLPIEGDCILMPEELTQVGGWNRGDWEIGVLGYSNMGTSTYYLRCESHTLNLVYRIPISFNNLHGAGLTSIGFSVKDENVRKSKFDISGLEGKSVGELFGKYTGWAFGGSFVAVFGAAGVRGKLEKSGIQINYSTLNIVGIKFGIDLRYEWTTISAAKNLVMQQHNNSEIIFDDLNIPRKYQGCGSDPLSYNCYIDVDLSPITDYKFVKVDPNSKCMEDL